MVSLKINMWSVDLVWSSYPGSSDLMKSHPGVTELGKRSKALIAFRRCSWPRLRFLTWIKEKPPRWHGAWKKHWLPTAHVQVQVRVRWTKDYTSSKTVWDFYQICYSWQQSERLKNHSIKISTVVFHFSWDVNDDHVKHCCHQVSRRKGRYVSTIEIKHMAHRWSN